MKNQMTPETFYKMPVVKSVSQNAIAAMLTMCMLVVYNVADMLFVGLTHDDIQVAAISLTTPLFMMFTAFSAVFSMGGTAIISRAIGRKEKYYINKVSAFCFWGSMGMGAILGILFFFLAKPILWLLGASGATYEYAYSYVRILAFCGPFCMASDTFSKVLVSDGKPRRAMMGAVHGNVFNCILDPILIIYCGMGVKGAAVATLISSLISTIYYAVYFMRNRDTTDMSINPKDFTFREFVFESVLRMGVPAATGPFVIGISMMFLNRLMVGYSDMALAGIGVASKIVMIIGLFCMGIGQGVQPLLGYSVQANARKRYQPMLRFSLLFALIVGAILSIIIYIFAEPLVQVFLTGSEAVGYGVHFTRILLTTSALFGVYYVRLNSLHAMEAATFSVISNLCRRGLIYIPAMFIGRAIGGMDGLVWAQPVTDILAMVLVAILSIQASQKAFTKNEQEDIK